MPALAPLACPPAPSGMPAGPPLSFPPVFSGNPVFFSSVPSFVWPCMGKGMDSRLKTSGMTWAESCGPAREKPWILQAFWHARSGPLSCLLWPLCHARRPPLSFPPVFSGNPVSFSSVPVIRVALHGKRHGFPIENVGNDMGRNRMAPHERSPGFCKPFGMPVRPLCHARQSLLSCPPAPSVMLAGF